MKVQQRSGGMPLWLAALLVAIIAVALWGIARGGSPASLTDEGRAIEAPPGAGHVWPPGPDGQERDTDDGIPLGELPYVLTMDDVPFGAPVPGPGDWVMRDPALVANPMPLMPPVWRTTPHPAFFRL